jgi:hypothetical protein
MQFLSGFFLLLGFFLLQTPSGSTEATHGTPGIKMTIQLVAGETRTEETTFIQSDRSRREYRSTPRLLHGDGTLDTRPGPRLAQIERCDLRQMSELNLDDREYVVASFPQFKPTKEQIEAEPDNVLQKAPPWVPTVREETKTVDTGERKNFFGHEARHVITTYRTTTQAGSHTEPRESVTDGWYIDLDTSTSCDAKWQPRNVSPRHEYYAVVGERYEIIDDGIRATGFPIERKYTSRWAAVLPDGAKREAVYVIEEKIVEFYEGPLDAALFEVPGEFRKVRDLRSEPPMTLADRWYFTRSWLKGMAKSIFE